MTGRRRCLVALAATLAPGRAAALMGRLASGAAALQREASALAAAPRRTRLAALAASLPAWCSSPPGIAPGAAAPRLWVRLQQEARWRPEHGQVAGGASEAGVGPGAGPSPAAPTADAARTSARAAAGATTVDRRVSPPTKLARAVE